MLTFEETLQDRLRELNRSMDDGQKPIDLAEFAVYIKNNPLPTAWSVSLQQTIVEYGPFLPGTAIIGVCEDRLPFILDMQNPETGAILLAGDPGCGKTNLLVNILASIVFNNTPNPLKAQAFTLYVNSNMLVCSLLFLPWALPRETVSGLLGRWKMNGGWKHRVGDTSGVAGGQDLLVGA